MLITLNDAAYNEANECDDTKSEADVAKLVDSKFGHVVIVVG
jgi:hypothetical protein